MICYWKYNKGNIKWLDLINIESDDKYIISITHDSQIFINFDDKNKLFFKLHKHFRKIRCKNCKYSIWFKHPQDVEYIKSEIEKALKEDITFVNQNQASFI